MKIAIIGTGLLGSSFALGLKESDPGHHIIGVEPIHYMRIRPCNWESLTKLCLLSRLLKGPT